MVFLLRIGSGSRFRSKAQPLNEPLDRLRSLHDDSKWSQCTRLLHDFDLTPAREKVLSSREIEQCRISRAGLAELFPHARAEVIYGDTPPENRREIRRQFEESSRRDRSNIGEIPDINFFGQSEM